MACVQKFSVVEELAGLGTVACPGEALVVYFGDFSVMKRSAEVQTVACWGLMAYVGNYAFVKRPAGARTVACWGLVAYVGN